MKQQFIKSTKALWLFALSAIMTLGTQVAKAQVKIGDNPTTINGGAALEIESTNKGVLLPRIALTSTTTWGLAGTQTAGMQVFNTAAGITAGSVSYPIITGGVGIYYWDGAGWVTLATSGAADSHLQFSVKQSTSQAIPANSNIAVNFNSKEYDKSNDFNLTTDQATIPINGTGYYQINAFWGTTAQTIQQGGYLYLYVNGVNTRAIAAGNASANAGILSNGSVAVKLNAGDIIKFYVRVNTGTTLSGSQVDVNQISQ